MAEPATQGAYSENGSARFEEIHEAFEAYDPNKEDSAYLRDHQVAAAIGTRASVLAITGSEFAHGTGVANFNPTGSGKTVQAGEYLRVLRQHAPEDRPLKSLFFTSSNQLRQQASGIGKNRRRTSNLVHGVGVGRFASELGIQEYGVEKSLRLDADVTVMNYHSIKGAVEAGFIDALNPPVIICDEAHHLTNGVWARYIEQLRRDRLAIGLTATPFHDDGRTASKLFPHVAIRSTLAQGIEQGYLSNVEITARQGYAQITDKDVSDADTVNRSSEFLKQLLVGQDSYMVASLAASHVERGGVGVISAQPGGKRAHARLLERTLRMTPVTTPSGEKRMIRAAHVDGDMSEDYVQEQVDLHRKKKLDALIITGMLVEGFDNPAADWMVVARAWKSSLAMEQLIGRVLRPQPGKKAHIDQIIYPYVGGVDDNPQISAADVLERGEILVSGRPITKPVKAAPVESTKIEGINIDNIEIDISQIPKLSAPTMAPLQEISVASGQEAIPYEWSSHVSLAWTFNESPERILEILEGADLLSAKRRRGDTTYHYFSERAESIISDALGLKPLGSEDIIIGDLLTELRSTAQHRSLTRVELREQLAAEELPPILRVSEDGKVMATYDRGQALNIFANRPPSRRKPEQDFRPKYQAVPSRASDMGGNNANEIHKKRAETTRNIRSGKLTDTQASNLFSWTLRHFQGKESLNKLTASERAEVSRGMAEIKKVMSMPNFHVTPPVFEQSVAGIGREPSALMKNFMRALKLSEAQLLYAAHRARLGVIPEDEIANKY